MSYLFYGRRANNSCYSHCFRAPLYRLRPYNRDDRHYSTLIMLRDFRFFLLAFCSLCPFIIHTLSFECFYYFARDLQNRRTTTIDQNWERFLGRPKRFLFFHRFFFLFTTTPTLVLLYGVYAITSFHPIIRILRLFVNSSPYEGQ